MTHQDITAYQDADATQAALGRIGFLSKTTRHGERIDRWNILRWFVNLATEDFAGMDAGVLVKRQEEFRALEKQDRDTGVSFDGGPPSREALIQFQSTVQQHLRALIERGKHRLGPFQFELSITVLKGRLYSNEHYVHTSFPPVPGEMLIFVLGRCLQQHGDLVRTCAWCGKLFLQQRRVRSPQRVAKYCSHYHRTLASKQRAAKTREAERQAATKRIRTNRAKVAKPSSRGKGRPTTTKGVSHGTKK